MLSTSRPNALELDARFMVADDAVAVLEDMRSDGALVGSGAIGRARTGSIDGITRAARADLRARQPCLRVVVAVLLRLVAACQAPCSGT